MGRDDGKSIFFWLRWVVCPALVAQLVKMKPDRWAESWLQGSYPSPHSSIPFLCLWLSSYSAISLNGKMWMEPMWHIWCWNRSPFLMWERAVQDVQPQAAKRGICSPHMGHWGPEALRSNCHRQTQLDIGYSACLPDFHFQLIFTQLLLFVAASQERDPNSWDGNVLTHYLINFWGLCIIIYTTSLFAFFLHNSKYWWEWDKWCAILP